MSSQISLRCHRELNDFLPAGQQNTTLRHELKQPRSVKDLIESFAIPHTEVDLILVNSLSVDFTYQLQAGDQIELYPPLTPAQLAQYGLNGPQAGRLRHNLPPALSELRFVLDVHLGRLAAYLRLLGFDCLYQNDYHDSELATISALQNRILLTCDRQLLMRKQVLYGYFVRARQPRAQLLEVVSRFDLSTRQKPFSRCMQCNGQTRRVTKKDIEQQLLPDTRKFYDEFYQCQSCGRIYWQGSHYEKLKTMIEELARNRENRPDQSTLVNQP